jgi:predicted tellurium resistance membrane protein TerC
VIDSLLSALPPLVALASPEGAAAAAAAAPHDLFSVQSAISLATLAALEIVLGIDNIVFIAILAGRLPQAQQPTARRLGISAAVVTRVLLLLSISWVMGLTRPFATIFGYGISGKQLILVLGGLFLIAKATHEIHNKLEGAGEASGPAKAAATMGGVIAQIMLIDVVFSLDSVITAVGMAQHLAVMVTAILIAAIVMMVFAGPVSDFVHRHPTMKMLALAFLILIGVMLVAEAFGQHVDRGYIYFAMAFSLGVELLNLRARRSHEPPVELRGPQMPAQGQA